MDMSATIIDGKAIAARMKEEVAAEAAALAKAVELVSAQLGA